jgi:hypothetical protein
VRYRCKFQFVSQTFTVILELLPYEICSVICDDAVWYSEAKDYGLDEVDCGCGVLGYYVGCFYPLGEFVDSHQHVNMPS